MGYRWWTTKEVALLRRSYGVLSPCPWPTRRIAETLGRTPHEVRSAARWYARTWQHHGRPSDAKFAAAYRRGLSDADIAATCNCSRITAWRWRQAAGLPPRGHHGTRPYLIGPRLALALRLMARGLPHEAIAAKLGMARSTVSAGLRRHRAGQAKEVAI